MFLALPIVVVRRVLVAVGVAACVLTFAKPASALPLCVGGEDFFDGGDGICRNFFVGDNAKFYLFDSGTGFEHLLRITVDTVLAGPEPGENGFGLRYMRNLVPAGSSFPGFPDLTCVPYGPGDMCVEYESVVPNDQPLEDVDYAGDVTWLISWERPIGTSPIPEIIHEIGEGDPEPDIYDEILEGIFFSRELGPEDFACDQPYDSTCFSVGEALRISGSPGDPTRASVSDNFGHKVAVVQGVPEPGTLALLGMGLGSLVLNARRRRRQDLTRARD